MEPKFQAMINTARVLAYISAALIAITMVVLYVPATIIVYSVLAILVAMVINMVYTVELDKIESKQQK